MHRHQGCIGRGKTKTRVVALASASPLQIERLPLLVASMFIACYGLQNLHPCTARQAPPAKLQNPKVAPEWPYSAQERKKDLRLSP